jgi:hypothetical protein
MNIMKANEAPYTIMRRMMLAGIDPSEVTVSMFIGVGGRSVMRARAMSRGVLITMDVSAD